MTKSMELFFIDNQKAWKEGARLVGDLVVIPDDGKYPTFIPVAIAQHPDYDGHAVMLAGNRGLILAFTAGTKSSTEVSDRFKGKGPKPVQYRIALDAIIHRMIIAGAPSGEIEAEAPAHGHGKGVQPFALLNWLRIAGPKEAEVLSMALHRYMQSPDSPADCELADAMHAQLTRPVEGADHA